MAMAAQTHQRMPKEQEEAEDVQHGPFPIEHLQASGIAAIDVKMLKDAELCTVESVAYSPRKDLLQIKRISEAEVDKIIEAASKLVPLGFTSASQLHAQRLEIIQITSGSRELDKEEFKLDLLLNYIVNSALVKLSCVTLFVSLVSFPWIKVVVKERHYILMLRVPLGPKDFFRLLTGLD
uniref:Uncharacterized protein n=1 Tax=Musa acuminata subsp. malaccensis TaxID=214687 RepID=A0A804KXQ4_MUSAM